MSNKQKTSKLWRILGIAVIALVVLAGFMVGAYSMGARMGSVTDGESIWTHPYARFENEEWEEDHNDGFYMHPMHGGGRMYPPMGFFVLGRILGGLFFLGLLFAAVRMIFFPHWRRSHFAGRYAPHMNPHFYHPGHCCGESAHEDKAEESEEHAEE